MARNANKTEGKDNGGGKAEARGLDPVNALALDRFVLGIWADKEFLEFLQSKQADGALKKLAKSENFDRSRAAEKLREEIRGRGRPTDLEKLEALIRESVDRAQGEMPILPELQHDMLANLDAVPKDDARAKAVKVLAELAAASQVNVAIQSIGRLAEATVDRVTKARADALTKLREILKDHPHLAPK